MFDKLPTKVNMIDTSGLVSKTQYGSDKQNLEKLKLNMLIKK